MSEPRESTQGCHGRSSAPETRIDAWHRTLPFWQKLVVWFVTMYAGFELPERVAASPVFRGVLYLVLIMGLFAGLTALFAWLNGR